jgi:hypothetical protein
LIEKYNESTDTVWQVLLRKRFSNLKAHPGLTRRQFLADKFLLREKFVEDHAFVLARLPDQGEAKPIEE